MACPKKVFEKVHGKSRPKFIRRTKEFGASLKPPHRDGRDDASRFSPMSIDAESAGRPTSSPTTASPLGARLFWRCRRPTKHFVTFLRRRIICRQVRRRRRSVDNAVKGGAQARQTCEGEAHVTRGKDCLWRRGQQRLGRRTVSFNPCCCQA